MGERGPGLATGWLEGRTDIMRRAGRSACYDLRRVVATRQGSGGRAALAGWVDARGVKRVCGRSAGAHWRRSGAATKQPSHCSCDVRPPGTLRLPVQPGQNPPEPRVRRVHAVTMSAAAAGPRQMLASNAPKLPALRLPPAVRSGHPSFPACSAVVLACYLLRLRRHPRLHSFSSHLLSFPHRPPFMRQCFP